MLAEFGVGKMQQIGILDRHNLSFVPKYHHLKAKLSRWVLGKSWRNC
jgi:hypothetical protein